ncbi:MAG: GtrA family protein [Stellaceae bacterium]
MQFFLYLIVGGLSFVVEIGVFVALRRAAMPVIAASVASFLVATIANYLLSILLAFQSGRFRRRVELTRFLVVVLVGLALNTALVWCFAYPLAIQPTVAKIAAVPIVLAWNYLGRRALVFSNRIPLSIPLSRLMERSGANVDYAYEPSGRRPAIGREPEIRRVERGTRQRHG